MMFNALKHVVAQTIGMMKTLYQVCNSTDTGPHWYMSDEITSTWPQPMLKICCVSFQCLHPLRPTVSVLCDQTSTRDNLIVPGSLKPTFVDQLRCIWRKPDMMSKLLNVFFFVVALNHPWWDQPNFVLSYILNVWRCLTLWWVVIHPPTSRRVVLFPHQSDQSRFVLPKRLETAAFEEGIQISYDPKANEWLMYATPFTQSLFCVNFNWPINQSLTTPL